jgi:predicted nucleic acid-binding protein
VSLLVDTSVWSLALRRDAPPDVPEVRVLRDALAGGEIVATTGVILQEPLAKITSRPRVCGTTSAFGYGGLRRRFTYVDIGI